MRKLFYFALLAAAVGGGWYVFSHYEIRGLKNLGLRPRDTSATADWPAGPDEPEPLAPEHRGTIRIATLQLGALDERKVVSPTAAGGLAQLARQFDLLAIQNVQARDQGVLMAFVEAINSTGRHYDFVTAPAVGREPVRQYSAFIFDRATIEVDRATVAVVVDPTHKFRRPPLVAAFRARGPDPSEAFTFTLINVHTDAQQAAEELDALADVFRAVRDDGRGEDDIILLGNLGTDERHLGRLGKVPHITPAVAAGSASVGGLRLTDNLLFDRRATVEFTGRSGIVDLVREAGLSPRDAAELSDHPAVWAEFSIYEGGRAGPVAARPASND
jgi:hypothetical protein